MNNEEEIGRSIEAKKKHKIGFELKITKRMQRSCELRCLGYKIPQIKAKLAEEGQVWSEDTIKRDLASVQAKDMLEELKRQQYTDIALCENRRDRMEYRDRMIERLEPRKSPDTQVNLGLHIQPKVDVEIFDHSKESTADKD